MRLRDYQDEILDQIIAATTDDIAQLDTGAGKTPIEAALSARVPYSMIVAHRLTLIGQCSEKLAAFGLAHDTVSTEYTRRRCIASHRRHHGRSHIQRGHSTRLVVSIDSLHAQLARGALPHIDRLAPWLIIIDEAHHVIPDNKWGRLREILPNARIVGFTATPGRMDGESLHASKGGLFDRLVQAPSLGDDSVRVLIERGYLNDFVVYVPPKVDHAALFFEQLDAAPSDEQSAMMADYLMAPVPSEKATIAARARGLDYESGVIELLGHPVDEYKRRANGTQAIMMCPAIKNAEKFALMFRDAGISAGAIHSKMPQSQITRALESFAAGRVRVICNVDMIGEGFDMPAVQTLIIATKTASFPSYRQWVGRVLRPAPGKERSIIIDLTRQVEAHGMPDEPVKWDLLNPPRCPTTIAGIPCDSCGAYYKLRLPACPECGAENGWLVRGEPMGNFEFDVRVLSGSLVQAARESINAERQALRRQSEIIWPHFSTTPGLVGRAVADLRRWFVDGLVAAGVEFGGINDFLESSQARETAWWMEHFTAADLKQRPAAKSKRVFKKWQAQQ